MASARLLPPVGAALNCRDGTYGVLKRCQRGRVGVSGLFASVGTIWFPTRCPSRQIPPSQCPHLGMRSPPQKRRESEIRYSGRLLTDRASEAPETALTVGFAGSETSPCLERAVAGGCVVRRSPSRQVSSAHPTWKRDKTQFVNKAARIVLLQRRGHHDKRSDCSSGAESSAAQGVDGRVPLIHGFSRTCQRIPGDNRGILAMGKGQKDWI